MAESSYHNPLPPHQAQWAAVPIVKQQFCAPYPLDLTITKKLNFLQGQFAVTDLNGNLLFTSRNSHFSIRDRRILVDSAGNPVLSLQQKIISIHGRWECFRGLSSNRKDLIFSVKKSSLIQFRTELDVFLASNTREDVCDFKIRGSWLERSCTILAANTPTIVAQMHQKYNVKSVVFGKETYGVTVYPFVDFAFISALILILYEVNADRED